MKEHIDFDYPTAWLTDDKRVLFRTGLFCPLPEIYEDQEENEDLISFYIGLLSKKGSKKVSEEILL
ncbi:MAG: hypothetical protein OXB93_03485, partial [Cytophagales bacterium]|nr:hypothetical protein [Cytophagales bacterium]